MVYKLYYYFIFFNNIKEEKGIKTRRYNIVKCFSRLFLLQLYDIVCICSD